jgi:hypothetical protein
VSITDATDDWASVVGHRETGVNARLGGKGAFMAYALASTSAVLMSR